MYFTFGYKSDCCSISDDFSSYILNKMKVVLWVYYTIPFGFSLFRHFLVITFQFFIPHFWLRITDEGSVPEMRIWSILLI